MRIFALLMLLLTLSMPAYAAEEPQHVTPRLFSPVTATGSGDTVEIGLQMQIEGKWETYWRTPGDAGLAPTFGWKGSGNFAGADVQWPAPHRFITAGLDNNVYTHEVTFPLRVKLAKPGDALSLKLHLDLLVCNDICVPEKHDLTFDLPAGMAVPSPDAALYDAALKAVPVKQAADFKVTQAWMDVDPANKNYLVIAADSAAMPGADADMFVEHKSFLTFGKPVVQYNAAAKTATFRMEVHSNDPTPDLEKALKDGDITLTYVDGTTAIENGIALGAKPANAPEPAAPLAIKEKIKGLDIDVLLAALIGGLILNLMPCVLPVLSLKVLSVVSHGGKEAASREGKAAIFRNFMASAAGIVASFWLMAGILSLLKAGGQSIGWGIQFQHPGFLVFLIVVVLLFAANMWGFFEIPLPRFIARHLAAKHEHEPTLAGHFLTGAFATLLATPCTAPFLGTAIGFALARGTFEIFAIFTVMGIGLALPYILLAVSPRLFRYMPRPGKWMLTLKKLLSVALLITAVWLGNVLFTISTMPALDAGWQKFDIALIKPAVDEGKTVVVDVTADWCLTCKANKKFVLEQKDVLEALHGENIVLLQADWTQRDEKIADYLHSFGRYGIPFNVVYGPGAPEGIPLPELLSKKAITDALIEAAGE
ncbi:MAG: protein-disulfide reductase DsbD family protein [Micavibrio sp.]|nr:protein-disulfide reductase DsbD family protein [Micavibrio sp.]